VIESVVTVEGSHLDDDHQHIAYRA